MVPEETSESERAEDKTDVSRYLLAAAEERMYRDRWLAGLSTKLHSFLKMAGNGDPRMVHEVIDSIDEFLRRSKK